MNIKTENETNLKLSETASNDASIANESPVPNLFSFAEVWLKVSTMLFKRIVGDYSQIGAQWDSFGSHWPSYLIIETIV